MLHFKQLAYKKVAIVHERGQLCVFTSQLLHNSSPIYYVGVRDEREKLVNVLRAKRTIPCAEPDIVSVLIAQGLLQATVHAPAIPRCLLCDHNGSALSSRPRGAGPPVVVPGHHPLQPCTR